MRSYNLSEAGKARIVAANKLPWSAERRANYDASRKVMAEPAVRAKISDSIRSWWRRDLVAPPKPGDLPWPKIERDADEAFRAANINFGGHHTAPNPNATSSLAPREIALQGDGVVAQS